MDGSQDLNTEHQPTRSTPGAGNNALDAAVFSIELMQIPSPEAAQAIKVALDTFAHELPGEQAGQPQGIFVAMGSTMPPFGEALRFVAKPTGEHAWRVQLTGPVLQVTCTQYTRYAEVWGQAKRYLQAMLAALDGAFPVANISHQYIDKFLYPPQMQEAGYSVGELFKADTPYLTQQAWRSGLEWHVYQGWFDYARAPQRRMLHQLNTSNVLLGAPQLQHACIIDHRATLQYPAAEPPTAGALAAQDGPLDSFMSELHTAHKAVFRDLLTPEKLQEIGMEH